MTSYHYAGHFETNCFLKSGIVTTDGLDSALPTRHKRGRKGSRGGRPPHMI